MRPTAAEPARLCYRWDDLTRLTGLSRRFLERALSAGELPAPDRTIRRVHLWHHETIDSWLRGKDGRKD